MNNIPLLNLSSGGAMPVLGQGTWYMGEDPGQRRREADALRLGLDLGMGLIDCAEMYAEGGAERVVGDAIDGRRGEVFLVSKVYPHNASRAGVVAACERSLRRLGTDYLDLYLLHWPGSVPLAETLAGFEVLRQAGKIRAFGVSNFDTAGLASAAVTPGGAGIVCNQVLYNLAQRGPEWDLLPWCRERGLPLMAYSPLDAPGAAQTQLLKHPALAEVARRHGATPAQVALAWLLAQPDVVVIPKAVAPQHVRQNRAALDLDLSADDLAQLTRAFPAPGRATPLQMR